MRIVRQSAIYFWTFPTSMAGLLFWLPTLLTGGGAQWVDGVLELHGGVAAWFLRRCIPLPGGASAMTLGHVVLGRDEQVLDLTRRHERIHVRQAERWGPLFIPLYLAACGIAWWRGGDPYMDNPFEREAYREA